jgi:hemerythrin-like domain-containing protein
MLRDKNLIPLSHQHQHALALCVRIDRATQAGPVDVEPWEAEIEQIVEHEIAVHFMAEEKHLFPAAAKFSDLQPVVNDLLHEHGILRAYFAQAAARKMDQKGLCNFVEVLATHIRKEERQLFEGMQQRMSADELAAIGRALKDALRKAAPACMLRPRLPKSQQRR